MLMDQKCLFIQQQTISDTQTPKIKLQNKTWLFINFPPNPFNNGNAKKSYRLSELILWWMIYKRAGDLSYLFSYKLN